MRLTALELLTRLLKMLQWFRDRAARVALGTLAWMIAVGGAAVAPHANDCHEAACHAVIVEHDASAHRVGAPSVDADIHPLHCLVCHWVRAFRPQTEARFVSTLAAEAGMRIPVQFVAIANRASFAQPPLRSPPASPINA
jgi:hypothetical protein